MKKKWFSDSSCPSNRCSSGEICSIKWGGGYGCCLSGDSCEIGYLPFLFFFLEELKVLNHEKKKKKN